VGALLQRLGGPKSLGGEADHTAEAVEDRRHGVVFQSREQLLTFIRNRGTYVQQIKQITYD
jgi:hypothetical protein